MNLCPLWRREGVGCGLHSQLQRIKKAAGIAVCNGGQVLKGIIIYYDLETAVAFLFV